MIWKRSPGSSSFPRASASTNPGSTVPAFDPKASPSPTCWAWSRTCRRGSSPGEGPVWRILRADRDREEPGRVRERLLAGSRSQAGLSHLASASCAPWQRSSPPGPPASCLVTYRCSRPGPSPTTCRTWRPRGTPTPVRLSPGQAVNGPHVSALVQMVLVPCGFFVCV